MNNLKLDLVGTICILGNVNFNGKNKLICNRLNKCVFEGFDFNTMLVLKFLN